MIMAKSGSQVSQTIKRTSIHDIIKLIRGQILKQFKSRNHGLVKPNFHVGIACWGLMISEDIIALN